MRTYLLAVTVLDDGTARADVVRADDGAAADFVRERAGLRISSGDPAANPAAVASGVRYVLDVAAERLAFDLERFPG